MLWTKVLIDRDPTRKVIIKGKNTGREEKSNI